VTKTFGWRGQGGTAFLVGLAAASLITQAACSSATVTANVPDSPVPEASGPTPTTLPPTAPPSPRPTQPSATVAVAFSGLRPGTYAAHLHSRCSGNQSFHITVLQSLRVAIGGRGSIEVPRSYFGRGLCVIVYSNTSLSRVLATRAI